MIKKIGYIFFDLLVLSPLCMLFQFGVTMKNILYDFKVLKVKKLNAPVISVGNISVGGSGKTPLVMHFLESLPQDICVGVLSRGYGSEIARTKNYPNLVKTTNDPHKFGDEPSMLAGLKRSVKVVLDSNRYRGGCWALKHTDVKGFILDDGFQHRKLHRDLNIVVFDVSAYISAPYLLPKGRFREPLASLKRADLIVLSKCKDVSASDMAKLTKNIRKITATDKTTVMEFEIISFTNAQGQSLSKESAEDILVFTGIGNPDVFASDVQRALPKANIVQVKKYADHYQYKKEDIQGLKEQAQKLNTKLVCTEKDYIKVKGMMGTENIFVSKQSVFIDEKLMARVKNIFLQAVSSKL